MKTKKPTIEEKVCTLEIAVNAISGKWKIPIFWQLSKGKKRPSEFVKGIGQVDRRVLNQQLKEMEADGLLKREVFNELPPRVEYSLTDTAKPLVDILWALNDWGKLLLDEQQKNTEDS